VRSVTESEDSSSGHQRTASGATADTVDWMGEVVKINGDGTVKVRLAREADPPPSWTGEKYVVTKAEDLIVFEDDDDDEDNGYDEAWAEVQRDWEPTFDVNEDDEWEDASEGDVDVGDDIPEASLDGMDVESPNDEKSEAQEAPANGVSENMSLSVELSQLGTSHREWQMDRDKCPAFDILETVPEDHPFKSDSDSGERGRDWLARIRKEHKILRSSLPGNSSHLCLTCRGHTRSNIRISS
jgi:hypothetical protein